MCENVHRTMITCNDGSMYIFTRDDSYIYEYNEGPE